MALTEAEELELLELEALEAGETPEESKVPWYQKVADVEKGLLSKITPSDKTMEALGQGIQQSQLAVKKLFPMQSYAQDQTMKLLEIPEVAGEAIAEKGPSLGLSPEVSAGIGTAVKMAPDIAAAPFAVKPAASLLRKGLSKVTSPITGLKNLIKAPGKEVAESTAKRTLLEAKTSPKRTSLVESLTEKKISPIREESRRVSEEMKSLGEKQVTEKQSLESRLSKSKEQLEGLEREKGLSFTELGVPGEVTAKQAPQYINSAKALANKTKEEILSQFRPEEIQKLRKQYQSFAKTQSPEVAALVGKAESRLGEAIEQVIGNDYASARAVFRESKDAIKNLPSTFKAEKSKLGTKLETIKNEIKKNEDLAYTLIKKAKKSDLRRQTGLQIKMAKLVEDAAKRDEKLKKILKAALAVGTGGGAAAGIGALIR